MVNIKKKSIIPWCAAAGTVNLALFLIKLYVGLSSNSIAIYSDSVNSLSDFLSCVLSIGCILAVNRLCEKRLGYVADKTEQLLSFVLSAAVLFVGLGFSFSSLERLMYPTPVWFSERYFLIILLGASAKLILYFLLRFAEKKNGSRLLKVMKADSLLDFFVTSVTLVSFTLTRYTEFSVDAVCGIVISVFICVQAVRLAAENVFRLLDKPPKETEEKISAVLEKVQNTAEVERLRFSFESGSQPIVYLLLSVNQEPDKDKIFQEISEEMKKENIEAVIAFKYKEQEKTYE